MPAYGTLHTAYITNGDHWERLDISSPTGELDIRDRFTLIIDSSTPEEVEAFFGPLFADRHLRGMPRLSRHSVNRASTHTLQALASDLDQIVGDLSAYFSVLFVSLRENKAGTAVTGCCFGAFRSLVRKSLIVIPRQAAEQLTSRSNGGGQTTTEITKALAEMGFAGESAAQAAEGIAGLSPQQRKRPETVAEALWPAYETAVLISQCADCTCISRTCAALPNRRRPSRFSAKTVR